MKISSKQLRSLMRLKAVGRIFIVASAFVIAFSTVEGGLILFLQQRAAALNQEAQDPIKAITEQKKLPKPLESKPFTKPAEKFGEVTPDVRKQADFAPTLRPEEELNQAPKSVRKEKTEDVNKRTKTSKTFRNTDGTTSVQYHNRDIAYEEEGKLKEMGVTVEETREYQKAPKNAFGMAGSAINSLSPLTGFSGRKGPMKADFTTLTPGKGITVNLGGQEIIMEPLQLKSPIIPERSHEGDADVMTYKNVWNGVDVVYEYRGDHVKEFIVLRNKQQKSAFSFRIQGASLRESKEATGAIEVVKDGKVAFVLPPLTVNVKEKGPVSDSGARYILKDDTVTVSLDAKWLTRQKDEHYPITIDPGVYPHSAWYEIANGSNEYVAYKNDGYRCPSWNCWVHTGWLNDNGRKVWQTMMRIPFDAAAGKELLSAEMHMWKVSNANGWYGTDAPARYWITWAPCFGFGCVHGAPWMPITIGTEGHADVRPLIQWMIDHGQWGGWMIIHGDDSPYKAINAYSTTLTMTYNTPPPVPTKAGPGDQGIVTTAMPRLEVHQQNDPDGDQMNYLFHLYNGSQFIASSGWQLSPRWVVPEGLLEDGTTYRWYVLSSDGYKHSGWTAPTSFTVDLRMGKDKTQTYDSAGPFSVNLADGNAYTSAQSHSIDALGGAMGIGLEYNTPAKSQKGLTAQYYNEAGGRQLVMTRTDPGVDLEWGLSSPKPGVVSSDQFAVNWQGYFIAPQTGNYTFGGTHDDYFSMGIDTQRNGQYQTQFEFGCCNGGVSWSGQSVHLIAGEAYPITIWHIEATGPAYARLWARLPDGQQVIPTHEWFRTKALIQNETQGLTGRFYKDHDGSGTFKPDQQPFLVQRFNGLDVNWGSSSPTAYDPDQYMSDNFLARFSGYLVVPANGQYRFGAGADDGQRIFVNGQQVAELWSDHGYTDVWSNPISLTAGQVVPITLEYYEHGGGAAVGLKWDGPAGAGIIPAQYLSTSYRSLPDGWSLSLDPDGNLPYERLTVLSGGNVNLVDGDGTTHTYTVSGGGYKPPVNEDGILVRNADGTFTLTDVDGRIYVFSVEGMLQSVTSPTDDRKPAALRYEYQSQGNVPRLNKIIDSVDPSRFGEVIYGGDTRCQTPAGFDTAPLGFVCAYKTQDNRTSNFYYKTAKLSRIEMPGGVVKDYATDGQGRITSVREPMANDVVATGARANDDSVLTQLTYDALGRAKAVLLPAPDAGGPRQEHTFEYNYGSSKRHITGAPEPKGYFQSLEYDGLQRTTKLCDLAALCTYNEWHPQRDLMYSLTEADGKKATVIYNDDDQPVEQYGPAPAAWYGTDRKPLATYAAQIPRLDTAYDEGMVGPTVAWYEVEGNSFFGAPKQHATGITPSDPAHLGRDFRTSAPPITPGTEREGYGFSATGKVRFPATGTYQLRAWHDDGLRVWVDDQLLMDNWSHRSEGAAQSNPAANFTAQAGKPYRFKVDYLHVGAAGALELWFTGPGIANSQPDLGTSRPAFVAPDYGLTTSQTTHDAIIGNVTTRTQYGATPEYGLTHSTTVDPGGLNLSNNFTFEAPGVGYLRQKTKILPGGGKTDYLYYSSTTTKDNPCTTATEAFKQAGKLLKRTEADPDGTSGSQTGRVTETIYDDAGRVVATRYNTESWTCTAYDARGRTLQVKIPAFGGEPARTITNNWAVDGNPLKTSSTDAQGTIVTEVDLLGRIKHYTDVFDTTSTTTYDNWGRMVSRTGTLGNETFVYDEYDRLIEQKLDEVVLAKIYYDSLGRVDHVDYPAAGTLGLSQIGRDALGRLDGLTWRFSDGNTISDRVIRSQAGLVLTNTTQAGTQQLQRSYGYDKASRLVSADIGPHTFRYGFGAQAAGCAATTNPNSGKNSNRTSQTVNGATTTYCYDHADRLIGSSNALAAAATYDAHGNMKKLGSGTTPLRFVYDSSDRNHGLEQYDANGNGTAMYYDRDAQDRIIGRYKNRIQNGEWIDDSEWFFGHTSADDAPDVLRNSAWDVVEKYVRLPGGALLTIKPAEPTAAAKHQFSLPNLHGDILVTTNGVGANTATSNGPGGSFAYDPFGTLLPGGAAPGNFHEGSLGWLGSAQRYNEASFTLQPMQMGARVYLPTLGRFAQVDPLEGGALNNYAYAADPINQYDTNGKFLQFAIAAVVIIARVAMAVAPRVPAIIATVSTAVTKAATAGRAVVTAVGSAITSVGRSISTAAQNVSRAFSGGRTTPVQQGQQGLRQAGVTQTNERIASATQTAKFRIPDNLSHSLRQLTEVKNVKYQGLTSQLKDFRIYSDQKSYEFILRINKDAKLSQPLKDLESSGGITIIRY